MTPENHNDNAQTPAIAIMSPHPQRRDKWNVAFLGDPLATAVRDPEHAACRALLEKGVKGRVTFVREKTGTPGLTMDIEKGAGLTTDESTAGGKPRTRKYRPYHVEGSSHSAFLTPDAPRDTLDANASPRRQYPDAA